MFKFMKSKKGFSLVELMIVVVIMAILVAVAVPIFNSVTGNARAKTCIDNQRSIVSTLNTALLEKSVKTGDTQTFFVYDGGYCTSYTAPTDKAAAVYTGTGSVTGKFFTDAELKKLFQAPPYCPIEGSAIKVVITGTTSLAGDSTIANIVTTCQDGGDDNNKHVLTKS